MATLRRPGQLLGQQPDFWEGNGPPGDLSADIGDWYLDLDSGLIYFNLFSGQGGWRQFSSTGGIVGPVFNVKAFAGSAAIGNGTTSASAAFLAAVTAADAANGCVFVPDPDPGAGYLLTSQLAVPADVRIIGNNKRSTRLILGYNGDMMNLGAGARLENLWLDGNGATFTGKGVTISSGQGGQAIRACRIISFAGYCLDFLSETAGSQFYCDDSELAQQVGASVGQEAVRIQGVFTASAIPRTFVGIQNQGKRFIDLGPCSDLFIQGGFLGELMFNANSRGVQVVGARLAGVATGLTILGANHAFSGNNIGPQVTVGAGVTQTTLKGNTYNTLPIIDQAFSQTNVLEDQKIVDRTVLGSGGGFTLFAAQDTTPSVGQGRDFQTANTSSTTITTFDDGVNGQRITVRLDLNTGITHNAPVLRLKGAASIAVGTVNSDNLIHFVRLGDIWFEEGRNF